MQAMAPTQVSANIIDQWWHDCSSTACYLPKEQTEEWLELISQVVRYFRLMQHCKNSADQKHFRTLCQHALAKSKWELMLLSVYGQIPQKQLHSLESLQHSLEKDLED